MTQNNKTVRKWFDEKEKGFNGKWKGYLQFTSVKNYILGSIGSKNSKIGNLDTFDEKIKNVALGNTLKGLEIFFKQYVCSSDFKAKFGFKIDTPADLIAIWKEVRDDEIKTQKFKQMIEDYITFLKNTAIRANGQIGFEGTTCTSYQGHIRGFCKYNGITIKFRNYAEDTKKSKTQDRYGVDFQTIKDISFRIQDYTKDFELKLVLKWMQISGLGSNELLSLNFGDLRRKIDAKTEHVKIHKARKKTGINFTTFIYGEVRDLVKVLLNNNADKADSDKLFGNEKRRVYNRLTTKFTRAYESLIETEYPDYKDADSKLFSMHGYRHIFCTICKNLRVPLYIENEFVAHASDAITHAYALKSDEIMLENFKLVQKELFGAKDTSTREEIKREIIESLINAIDNDGKRGSNFKKFDEKELTEEEFNNDIQIDVMVQMIFNKTKAILLNDEDFLLTLKQKLYL